MNLPVPADLPPVPTAPAAEVEPLSAAAIPTEWPAAGGRYQRDPATGALLSLPDEAPATPSTEGP